MVETVISDPLERKLSEDSVSTDEALSDPEDNTSISLSNLGIETDDLLQVIRKENIQSLECFPMPRIPSVSVLRQAMTIVRLDLSRNKLTSLPKELFGENTNGLLPCPMLEYLDVGRNQLKEIPSEIRNCKRLKILIALSNKIRLNAFPLDAIASLPLLEVLDLRWNQKLNNQSSRRRLIDVFQNDGDKIDKKRIKLLLSPTTQNSTDPNAPVAAQKKLSACDRDANDLRSQLEPLSTPQLRKRLHRTFRVSFDDGDERAYDRENIMQQLLQRYNTSSRSVRYERGVALDPTLLEELLFEMEAIRWPRTTRERPKISAEGYVILQRPLPSTETTANQAKSTKANNKSKREAEKLKRFIGIWTKAFEAIESVDKEFAQKYTALAVTKNFRGSPHIDTLNIAPFYGLSVGDFTPSDGGGKLCVECSATCVAEIDTRGRLAKVDGRFCHWVSDYGGTRYSLIYYITHGDVVPQTTAIFNDNNIDDWIPPPVFLP